MDDNVGKRGSARPGLQRAGGQRFSDGVQSRPYSDTTTSASVARYSTYPMSALATTVGKGKGFVRDRVKQTKQSIKKIKHQINQLDQYEFETDRSKNEERDVDAPLPSLSSSDVFSNSQRGSTDFAIDISSGRIPRNISVEHTMQRFQNMQLQHDQISQFSHITRFTTNSALLREFDDDASSSASTSVSFKNDYQSTTSSTTSHPVLESSGPSTRLTTNSALLREFDDDASSPASSSVSFKNENLSTTSSTSSHSMIGRYDLSKHVSILEETNYQYEDTIKQLRSRIKEVESQLQSQNESMTAELNQWIDKHTFAEKELQGPCLHHAEAVKDPPAQSNEDKFEFHQLQEQSNEITEKLARLMDENGQLLAKRQIQREEESQHVDLLVLVEDLQSEKDKIHMLMTEMSAKLVHLEQVHEDCIQRYETQLSRLNDEILHAISSTDELNMTSSIATEEAYKMCEILQLENEEAYKTCGVFQQEIDLLHDALEERCLRANYNCPIAHHRPWHMDMDDEERDSYLDDF
ncbi:hypothetical protein ACHAXA_010810 [Cyclostephanos tholiformis]|uniref:Uncharacterized protein n=1 Tax=Cyclostephanos tholiformis TaxID=382380 RepID=A0ABD3R5I0_9STRA